MGVIRVKLFPPRLINTELTIGAWPFTKKEDGQWIHKDGSVYVEISLEEYLNELESK